LCCPVGRRIGPRPHRLFRTKTRNARKRPETHLRATVSSRFLRRPHRSQLPAGATQDGRRSKSSVRLAVALTFNGYARASNEKGRALRRGECSPGMLRHASPRRWTRQRLNGVMTSAALRIERASLSSRRGCGRLRGFDVRIIVSRPRCRRRRACARRWGNRRRWRCALERP
jgi:hypothetical protein